MNLSRLEQSELDTSSQFESNEQFQQEITQKTNEKKIPLTSERCIIFPFDKVKLRYLRDTYRKILIKDICTAENITQVITDVEAACDDFKEHHYYRKIMRFGIGLGFITFLAGIILTIIGMFLAQKPSNASSLHKSGLHIDSVIGMMITSLSVIAIYLVLITVGHKTKNLNMIYIAKYDKVLASYRSQFNTFQMRWRIGVDRLWLELWLDYNKAITGLSEYDSNSNILDADDSILDSQAESYDNSKNEEPEEEKSIVVEEKQVKQKGNRHPPSQHPRKENRDSKGKGFSKFDIAAARTLFKKPQNNQKEAKEE